MIAVVCGTREGREIASLLVEKGFECIALTTTEYGKRLAGESGVEVISGNFTGEKLNTIFSEKDIKTVVDVSHPFAHREAKLLKKLCDEKQINYIRYLREETEIPENSLIHPVTSWQEAAEYAGKLGNTIFLTTGSHNLEEFLEYIDLNKKRVVVRVLPDHKIIKKCQDLGFAPKDIVAMQGPFSKQMNRWTFKMYNASVVITKDSGKAGGTDTKVSAALDLKIPVVVIKRPFMQQGKTVRTYDEVLQFLRERSDQNSKQMRS